jgi:threonine/homoserine/homoserine lactone efflux protein
VIGSFLLKGVAIGFAIAAPVGPVGIVCIQRTLADGRASGLFSGLGAATADALYGSIAAFGMTVVTTFLVSHEEGFRLVGGLFLLGFGLKIGLAKPTELAMSANSNGLVSAYISTLFLTLANPLTILSFAAVFAGLGLGSGTADYWSAGALVLGVFLGSGAWWLVLSLGVAALRDRLKPSGLRWVNWASGGIIMGFGVLALLSLL